MHSLHVGDVRSARSSERDLAVFTPPRDDLGVAPRCSEFADKLRPRNNNLPMKQALCVFMRIICFIVLVIFAAFAMYTAASILIGRKHKVLCVKQTIPNGLLMSEGNDAVPSVSCNEGYEVASKISPDFKCRMVMKHCSVVRRASLIHKEKRRCHRRYAFVTEAVANASLALDHDNDTSSMRADERQMAVVQTAATLNATCINKNMVKEMRLYGERSQQPHLEDFSVHGVASSLAALATLVMIPVMVLSVAERAHAPGREDGANEPGCDMVVPADEAPLLSCDAATADGGDESA